MLGRLTKSDRLLRLVLLAPFAALVFELEPATGQMGPYFYAIGGAPGKRVDSSLYKVDRHTKQVLASVEPLGVDFGDLALSGDGRLLFALGGVARVFVFDADRLSLLDQFSVRSNDFPWAGSL